MPNMEDRVKVYIGEIVLRVAQLEAENESLQALKGLEKDLEDYKRELERVTKELEDVKKITPAKSRSTK